MRYFVKTVNGYGPARTPRTWYAIHDAHKSRKVAVAYDPIIAHSFCAMLNGDAYEGLRRVHAAYDKLRADLIAMISTI